MFLLNDEHIFLARYSVMLWRRSLSPSLKIPFHRPEVEQPRFRDYERRADDRREASRRDSSICARIREQENPTFSHSDHFLPSFFEARILFTTRQRSFFNDGGIDTFNYEHSRINRRGCSIPTRSPLATKRFTYRIFFFSRASRTSVFFSPCCRSNVDKGKRNIRTMLPRWRVHCLSYFHRDVHWAWRLSGSGYRSPSSFHGYLVTLRLTPAALAFYCRGRGTRVDYIGNPHFHSIDKYKCVWE